MLPVMTSDAVPNSSPSSPLSLMAWCGWCICCCLPSLWGVTVFYNWKLKDGSHWPMLACVFNQSYCVWWNGRVEMTEPRDSVGKRPEWVITHIELLVIPLELLSISVFLCLFLSYFPNSTFFICLIKSIHLMFVPVPPLLSCPPFPHPFFFHPSLWGYIHRTCQR